MPLNPKLLLMLSGGIPLNGYGKSGCQTATASYTMNATVGGGANRVLIVGVAILTTLGSVSSVASDVSGSFTKAIASTNTGIARSEIWSLTAPATGAHVITVTLSGAISSDAMWASVFNTDQTTPVEATGSATGTSGTPSASVTTATTGAYLLTHIASSNKTLTATAPAVLLTSEVCTPGEGATATQTTTAAGSYSMAWGAVGVADVWTQTIVSIKPVTASVASIVGSWFYRLVAGRG